MLEIQGLHKSFTRAGSAETFWALQDVNLTVNRGEFMTWLGPSGCGKTTLLRCLAGLESPSEGHINFEGQNLLGVSAQERPFHMVFQRYALFPHMSVEDNIRFPLRIRKISDSVQKDRVQFLLEMMGLEKLRHQKPGTLSGGQSQRVALARALANQPQVLLLDEPLSALDEKIRSHLRQELKELQKKVGITFIFVTHDQQEALQLSDRVAVFHEGRLHQVGRPEEIYSSPQTDFVARFIGSKNEILKSGFIYPEKVFLSGQGDHQLEGILQSLDYLGREYEVLVRLKSSGLLWKVIVPHSEVSSLRSGQSVLLSYYERDVIRVPLR